MEGYFVLDDRGEPVPERNLEAWTRWFERADRSISRTIVTPEITVLTTFRGVDRPDATARRPCSRPACSAAFSTARSSGTAPATEAIDAHAVLAEWCRIASLPTHGITADQIR